MIIHVYGLEKHFSNNITSIKTKLLFPWSKLQPGMLPIFSWIFLNKLSFKVKPDLVISCGRKSVYLSIFLKKKFNNLINIHIQNPKTNFKSFDFIVAPNHDDIKGKNVIISTGALHKFTNFIINEEQKSNFNIPKKKLISVLIGGSNNHYNFSIKDVKKLILKIKNIKNKYPYYKFLILSSRRTSDEMIRILEKNLKNIAFIWKKNQKNPYIYALKYSDFFIVTSDSTSMISECAFTGKPIYVFNLPFKRKSMRLERFHKEFNNLNITKTINNKFNLQKWNYKTLDESERIASILKERIIKA